MAAVVLAVAFMALGLVTASQTFGQIFRRPARFAAPTYVQPTCPTCPTTGSSECPTCPAGSPSCPTCPTETPDVQESPSLEKLGFELATGDWGRTAARCIVGNSCGSASLVGHYNGGTLFLTNAHVTGTRPGTAARLRMRTNGSDVEYNGRVIMVAYSDKTLTDWSIVMVDQAIEIEPRPLSTERPAKGDDYTTVGSPRCVWPQVRQDITTADLATNSPLWRWRPNSIGGQSGSGVWSIDDGNQYGLLTWSWGGLGAGQMTSEIYRQATNQTVAGEPRPDGLQPLTPNAGVVLENGFFMEAGITDLPIWAGKAEPKPDTPDCPDCPDLDDLNSTERVLVGRLKAAAQERGADWIAIVKLIIQLLEMLRK